MVVDRLGMPEAAGPSGLGAGLGPGLAPGLAAPSGLGPSLGPTLGPTLAPGLADGPDGAGPSGLAGGEGAAALSDEPDLNIFENKSGLAEDMKFLASMPELCDVTFMVGDSREPVCAVKAVLAARSK